MFAFVCLNSLNAVAQRSVTNQNLVWAGANANVIFNDKLYLQTEIDERKFINPFVQHQFLVRSHLHYVLGKSGWEVGAGMCYFLQNNNDPNAAVRFNVPELRPHLEFDSKQKLKYFTLDHRYKVEARIFHNVNSAKTELDDGYYFGNYRFRYRLQATIPILKLNDAHSLRIKLSEELLINAGNKIVKNVFDNARFYAGINLDILKNLSMDIGYLNWFQEKSDGSFYNRNILRFGLAEKINLHKN